MKKVFTLVIRTSLIAVLLLVTAGLFMLSWWHSCPCCRF
jgi:hypothetical protein